MRGKEVKRPGRAWSSRITPAYAGKRPRFRRNEHKRQDHPRVCGEKRFIFFFIRHSPGSPPRMRGKGQVDFLGGLSGGITPAYAGKSHRLSLLLSTSTDHPRVCGEKFVISNFHSGGVGSPPRMRGKVRSIPRSPLILRITPAYAGKRLKRSRSTVPPVAIVPLFPSVCNKPVVSDGSPAGRDAPLFLPAENAVPASPAYNLRSL